MPCRSATLDLVSKAIGIGDRSAIQGHDETHRADQSTFQVHRHFGNQCGITVLSLVGYTGDAAPRYQAGLRDRGGREWTWRPSGSLGRSVENANDAAVAQMLQAKGHRVRFRMGAELIHEAFVGKGVLDALRESAAAR